MAAVLAGIAERDRPKIWQAVVEVHVLGNRLLEMAELFRLRGFTVKEQEEVYPGSDRHNLYGVRCALPVPPLPSERTAVL